MPFALEQQHHRLPVHGIVVYDENAHARQAFRRCGKRRVRAEHAARQRHDDFGARAAAARPQPQVATRRLRECPGQRELHLATAARLGKAERRRQPLLRFNGQGRTGIPQRGDDRGSRRDHVQPQLARRLSGAQPAQREVEQFGQHLRELRHRAGHHGQVTGNRAQHLDAQLAECGLALRQDAVDHDRRIAGLRGARRVRGQLQEMARDLGRAPHFAVQQHEGAGALRIEGSTVEQIGERADGGEAVVQGVQNVCRTVVEDDVRNGGGCGGFGGRWRF